MASRTQSSDCLDSSQDVAVSVRCVGLADVGERFGIAEHREGLLQLFEVVRAQDDGCGLAVTRDGDSVMLALDAVDNVAEVVANLAERLDTHGHNCGPARLASATSGPQRRMDALRGTLNLKVQLGDEVSPRAAGSGRRA